jgi:Glu-tRNA(Gln) amidotransferase subunit E-like FAD-binding protein
MPTTITLPHNLEDVFQKMALSEGVSVEVIAARRLEESELLWRIRTVAPEEETRLLHRLLRKQRQKTLTDAQHTQLLALLDVREQQAAQRMEDLATLARMRNLHVRELMNKLGIAPIIAPQ